MDWYRIKLRLAAPTPSPWHADTIFGHLCWALAHVEGAAFMEDFLGLYGLGAPPVVISNGFPGDLLPRPLLTIRRQAAAGGTAEARLAFRQSKESRAASWLTREEFDALRLGGLVQAPARRPFRSRAALHNQIDRATSTTGKEGSLYTLEETYLAAEYGDCITVYALVDPGFAACLGRCLAHLAATGYGKRKSAGYGAIAQATLEPFAGFAPVEGENGFIALSNFVPAAGDPTRGAWNTLVKRGKVAEEFALAGDPFKLPVLMLAAGSCFYDLPVRPYYGRLVPGVHPDLPQVVQYGLALAVSARLPALEVAA